jgi:hypothetical protein
MFAFWPIADIRTERPNIALNDAMILSYDANLGRMEFSERTASLSATAAPAGIAGGRRNAYNLYRLPPGGLVAFICAIFAFTSSTIWSTERLGAFWLGGYATKVSRNLAALNTPSWAMSPPGRSRRCPILRKFR